MCGRYSLSTSKLIVQEELEIQSPVQLLISYNIAPTQLAYVITNRSPNTLQQMHWGILPAWSTTKVLTGKMINARAESIFEKPSFKESILKRRCLVPADSFYEWRKEGKSKKPFRILPKDGSLMTLAGIWEVWQDADEQIYTFSIITCAANSDVDSLHNRMPILLNKQQRQSWLGELSIDGIKELLQTPRPGLLKMYRISEKANSPRFNQASIHQEVNDTLTLF